MQMTDRLTLGHFDTRTDSGLVQIGNAAWPRWTAVMSANDDAMMDRSVRGTRTEPDNDGTGPLAGAKKFHGGKPLPMTGRTDLWSAAKLAPRRCGRALVKVYRYTFSPLIGFHCRHLPTCSDYADEALDRHGLWPGGWMTLARLLRCHPCGTSGLDLVPKALPLRARWYLPWRFGRWRGTNAMPETAQQRGASG